MLHTNGDQRTHLHFLVTRRDGDCAVLGQGQLVKQIDQQRARLVIGIKQSVILKTVREDKKQARVEHGEVDMLTGTRSLPHIKSTGHSLTGRVGGNFVANQGAEERWVFLALSSG